MKYNEDIYKFEMTPFATSCTSNKYLLVYNERHFEISESLFEFIVTLQNHHSINDVITEYSQKKGVQYSENDIDNIYNKYVDPILKSNSKAKKIFYFKLNLISPKAIHRLVTVSSKLFIPSVVILVLLATFVLQLITYLHGYKHFAKAEISFLSILLTLGYFCFSSFLHELGHAASCKHFKIDHGAIGIGIYFLFPVFFTDVSNVWKLSRKKRIVVNFAGVYFQLIALFPFLIIYLLTGNELMLYFISAININLLITLNPFFKFDGYWICTDILGVPNLRSRTNELVRYAIKRITKRPYVEKAFLLTLKRKEKWGFIIYSLLVNLFFGYFFFYKLPLILISSLNTFPINMEVVLYYFSAGDIPSLGLLKSLGFQLILILIVCFAIIKTIGFPLFYLMRNRTKI